MSTPPRLNRSLLPSSATIDVTKLRRPASGRYQALIKALVAADQGMEQGLHSLKASILALDAVSQFIGSDESLRLAGVSVSLRKLSSALNDTAFGGKPHMLFGGAVDQPEETERKKAGRRPVQTFHTLRGLIVEAVNGLIDVKMKREEAAKTVEKMLADAGVRLNGKMIEAKRILQWREQTNDSAPKGADEAIASTKEIKKRVYPANATLEDAKLAAFRLVTVVSWHNSN
jgi:hypothetical protein